MEFITLGETMVLFAPKETGRLRYQTDFRMRIAGAESNCAVGIQRLGHSAGFISRVGADEFGEVVVRSLRAEGVDCGGVQTDSRHATGLMFKETTVGNETRVTYYRRDSAASHLTPKDLDETAIASAKLLHLTGITPVLSDSCRETVFAAAAIARQYRVPISFDPNIRRKLWGSRDYAPLMRELIGLADYVLLGLDEGTCLYGTQTPKELLAVLFRQNNLKAAAVKDSAHGAWVGDGEQAVFVKPYLCRCIDPVGAGDAFNAGFLTGVLEDLPLAACGERGAILGAKATEINGDIEGYLSAAELQDLLDGEQMVYR